MVSEKIALLIGISNYKDNTLAQLQKPEVDVNALAAVLRDRRIGAFDEVQTLVDASFTTVRQQIARLFQRRKHDDLVLLYFAGHGVRDINDGQLYLAATDTDRNLLSADGISASFISRQMDNSGSQRQVVILDCCFSGAFSRDARSAVNARVDMETIAQGKGQVVMTASTATQFAWEGERIVGEPENSVFTRHLVAGLKTGDADIDGDGRVSFDELYNYVRAGVISTSGTRQTPTKSGQQVGVLFLARNPNFSGEITRELTAEVNTLVLMIQESICPLLNDLNQNALAKSLYDKGADLGQMNQDKKITPVVLLGLSGVGKTSLMNAVLGKVVGRAGTGGPQSAAALVVSNSPKRFVADTFYISIDELLEYINRVRVTAFRKDLSRRPDEQRLANHLIDFLETALANWEIIKDRDVTLEDLNESVAELILQRSRQESFSEEDFDGLSEYVKVHTNSKGVYWVITKEMEISGPFPGLPEHVKIMDLPGLGDLNKLRVQKTRQALKEAEQLLIVVDDRGLNDPIREMLSETHIISFLLTNPNIPQIMVIGTKLDNLNVNPDDLNELGLSEDAQPHQIIQAQFASWSRVVKNQWNEMLRTWVESTSVERRVDYSAVDKITRQTEFIPCSPVGFLKLAGLEKDWLNIEPQKFPGNDGQVNYNATGIPNVRKSIKGFADEQQRLRKVKIRESYKELRRTTLDNCHNLLKGLLANIEYSEHMEKNYLQAERKLSRMQNRNDYRLSPAVTSAKNRLGRARAIIAQGWQELDRETIDKVFNETLGEEHYMVVMAAVRRVLVYASDKANIHIPSNLSTYVAEPITNLVNQDVFETFLTQIKQTVGESTVSVQNSITKILEETSTEEENELLNSVKKQAVTVLEEHQKEVEGVIANSLGDVSTLKLDVLELAYLAIRSGFHAVMRDPIEQAAIEEAAKGRGGRQRVIDKLVDLATENKDNIIAVTAETFNEGVIEHLQEIVTAVEEQLVNLKSSTLTSLVEYGNALRGTMLDKGLKEKAKRLEGLLETI